MAYFCLSFLEAKAGSRKQAAKQYRIDKKLLNMLGRLASTKGDKLTARKVDPGTILTPLTATQISWLEAVVKAIIQRVGEIDSDPSLPVITMHDLPSP